MVALDSVTDPRNLGAVVRSAAAFGAHGVLVPERRSATMTASAWKVSAGAAARVPVAMATNLVRALGQAKEAGCFVVGLDGEADASIDDDAAAAVLDGPLVLVVGSEGAGLSRLVRSTCDLVVAIPTASAVESLNASVAAGIALHAAARARAVVRGSLPALTPTGRSGVLACPIWRPSVLAQRRRCANRTGAARRRARTGATT